MSPLPEWMPTLISQRRSAGSSFFLSHGKMFARNDGGSNNESSESESVKEISLRRNEPPDAGIPERS
jgi:hypothetical protein